MAIFALAGRLFGALAVVVPASLLAPAAQAASEAVVYSFKGSPDGAYPEGTLLKVGGMLYGTTDGGGIYNKGTVFSVSPHGVERVLWSFGGGKDGAYPNGSLVDVNGTLYGTTGGGGDNDNGTVFSITLDGHERVLWYFGKRGTNNRSDGVGPSAGLTAVDGVLWGTTLLGGLHHAGVVFSVTPAGAESVVYSFQKGYDAPTTPLLYLDGFFYGATDMVGIGGCGLVFSVSPSGVEKSVYASPSCAYPNSLGPRPNGLMNVGTRLFGTTYYGGVYEQGGKTGVGGGTAYSLTRGGVLKVLWNFGAPDTNDGIWPFAGLINVGGTLYGTTLFGGDPNAGPTGGGGGCGTAFSLKPTGVESVLYAFQGYNSSTHYSDGCFPWSALTEIGPRFYGTTYEGGTGNAGTIFWISR